MSQENKTATGPAPAKSATVKVRFKTRHLLERTFEGEGEKRSVASETWAMPGEVLDLPRAEAERLLGRAFEGYPTTRDEKWTETSSGGSRVAPFPLSGGKVKDPIVELVVN